MPLLLWPQLAPTRATLEGQRLRDQIIGTKLQPIRIISIQNLIWNIFFGEGGKRFYSSDFHGLRNVRGMTVKRTSEDKWKAQNIVDLIGIV